MNTDKLKTQLFIGKVVDIIGFEKTMELLKEAKDTINDRNIEEDEIENIPFITSVGYAEGGRLVTVTMPLEELKKLLKQ